jgi:hypothetical protein
MRKTGTKEMKRIPDNEACPAVHSWNYITIEEPPRVLLVFEVLINHSYVEGYCMLNTEYRMCHDRYNYRLNPDRSFTRIKNERYDPKRRPEPYPEDCKRSVRSSCIGCRHFAWCDLGDEDPGKTGKNETEM